MVSRFNCGLKGTNFFCLMMICSGLYSFSRNFLKFFCEEANSIVIIIVNNYIPPTTTTSLPPTCIIHTCIIHIYIHTYIRTCTYTVAYPHCWNSRRNFPLCCHEWQDYLIYVCLSDTTTLVFRNSTSVLWRQGQLNGYSILFRYVFE